MHYGNSQVYLTQEQREQLIARYLGRTQKISIDRPVGHVHTTKGITLHYTLNYGYLPGVMGGDGEEQDVYLLGVDVPVTSYSGTIVGVIRRRDDNEDKLLAAPEGMVFSHRQIWQAVQFVEQYFDSTLQTIWDPSISEKPF